MTSIEEIMAVFMGIDDLSENKGVDTSASRLAEHMASALQDFLEKEKKASTEANFGSYEDFKKKAQRLNDELGWYSFKFFEWLEVSVSFDWAPEDKNYLVCDDIDYSVLDKKIAEAIIDMDGYVDVQGMLYDEILSHPEIDKVRQKIAKLVDGVPREYIDRLQEEGW